MGIPFVCAGLYIIFGRFLHLRWAKQNTWYALTDKRVVIVTRGLMGQSIKEQDLKTLTAMDRRLRRNDSGTIDFAAPTPFFDQRAFWPVQKLGSMAFIDIPEVNKVYELLLKARADA